MVDGGGRLGVAGAASAPDLAETKKVRVKAVNEPVCFRSQVHITDETVKERLQCKATSKRRSHIITFEGRKAAFFSSLTRSFTK